MSESFQVYPLQPEAGVALIAVATFYQKVVEKRPANAPEEAGETVAE